MPRLTDGETSGERCYLTPAGDAPTTSDRPEGWFEEAVMYPPYAGAAPCIN
jgi:hypothetical protein